MHQRQAYRNEEKIAAGIPSARNPDRISADRIAKLNKVGFIWGTYRSKGLQPANGSKSGRPKKGRARLTVVAKAVGRDATAAGSAADSADAAEAPEKRARAASSNKDAAAASDKKRKSKKNAGAAAGGVATVQARAVQSADAGAARAAQDRASTAASRKRKAGRSRSKAPLNMKRIGWDKHFEHLKLFVEEFGHANVRLGLDTDKYPRLGNWVLHQRQAYHNEQKRMEGIPLGRNPDRISQERIEKLNALNFRWGKRRTTTKWEDGYALLLAYINENGDSHVPRNLDTDAYPNLGKWVVSQRNKYRFAKMPAEVVGQGNAHSFSGPSSSSRKKGRKVVSEDDKDKIAQLDAVGFDWGRWTPHWDERFASLKRYLRGNTRVNESLDTEAYPKLGLWVKKQRENYRCTKLRELGLLPEHNLRNLSGTRIAKLESIRQWDWGDLPKEIEWPMYLQELKDFVAEHGHANVDRVLATAHNAATSTAAAAAPTSTAAPIAVTATTAAGGDPPATSVKEAATSTPAPARLRSKRFSPELRKLQLLEKWLHRQRRAYHFTKLRDDGMVPPSTQFLEPSQIEELESLGIQWGTMQLNAWESCFLNLAQFVRKHNHADVPSDLDTTEFPRLGYWATRQRQAWRVAQQVRDGNGGGNGLTASGRVAKRPSDKHATCGALSADRIQQLEALGFDWREKAAWDKKFALLRRFIEEFGHCSVPHRFSTDDYPGLGRWVDVQRKHYRKRRQIEEEAATAGTVVTEAELEKRSLISSFQVQMLEVVGLDWGARALNRWERNFDQLKAYQSEHGHLRVATNVYPKLAAWVHSQRRAYHYEQSLKSGNAQHDNRSTRISADRIAKLNSIGFQWALRKPRSKRRLAALEQASTEAPAPAPAVTVDVPQQNVTNQGAVERE